MFPSQTIVSNLAKMETREIGLYAIRGYQDMDFCQIACGVDVVCSQQSRNRVIRALLAGNLQDGDSTWSQNAAALSSCVRNRYKV